MLERKLFVKLGEQTFRIAGYLTLLLFIESQDMNIKSILTQIFMERKISMSSQEEQTLKTFFLQVV